MFNFWYRFTWNLEDLPPEWEGISKPYAVRIAKPEEKDTVLRDSLYAISMDSSLGDSVRMVEELLHQSVEEAFRPEQPNCFVIAHGVRIIAISVFSTDPDAENHLLSGPCVLHEYRSRGLASSLTACTLHALREAGLKTARGLAKNNSSLARYVYPKFPGTKEVYEFSPRTEPKLTQ